MKKSLNYLLILSVICLALTSVLCFSSIIFSDFNLFPVSSEVVENVNNAGEGNPGAGWYLLIVGGIGLGADLAMGFILIFILLFIPFFMNIFIIASQGIARLFQIGLEKNWKNTVSKVFTVISIIIQTLLCLLLLLILLTNLEISKILLFLALALNITSIVIFIKEFTKMIRVNINSTAEIINQ